MRSQVFTIDQKLTSNQMENFEKVEASKNGKIRTRFLELRPDTKLLNLSIKVEYLDNLLRSLYKSLGSKITH